MAEFRYPISEQIARAMFARLKEIGEVAGTPVSEVVRPTKRGVIPKHLGVYLFQAGLAEPSPLEGNESILEWSQIFVVTGIVRPTDAETETASNEERTSIDTLTNIFVAEIEKKLMEDETWGGLAVQTRLGGRKNITDDDAFGGADVLVEVVYRTSEKDPYQKR